MNAQQNGDQSWARRIGAAALTTVLALAAFTAPALLPGAVSASPSQPNMVVDSPSPISTVEPEYAIMQYILDHLPQGWNCDPVGGTPGHRWLSCYTGMGHGGSGTVDNYGDPSVAHANWLQKRDHAQSYYPSFEERFWNGYPGYHGEGELPPYNFFYTESYYWAGVRVLGGTTMDDTGYHYAPDLATEVMNAAQALGYLPPPSPTPTPGQPDLVGEGTWSSSCDASTIVLRTELNGTPNPAGPSTMRLQNREGDYIDIAVPALGGPNPPHYDYPCAIGTCIPEGWQSSLPYTLTVDIFNEVAESDESNNQTLLYGLVPTPVPCMPTITPTGTPSISPTPECCTDLAAGAYGLCLWEHNVWVGGSVTNNCAQPILGSYLYCLELATSPSGPWTPLACAPGENVYFEVGENEYGGYYTNGFPHEYSWYRVHMTASSADGCWQAEAATTPAPICFEATPGITPTFTPAPTGTPSVTPTITPLPDCTVISSVTLTPVTHTPAPSLTPVTPTPCVHAFMDVPPGSTFYSFVTCLACRNIVSGYGDGTFRPSNTATRGQIAKIVSNSAGLYGDPGGQKFEDVPISQTFYVWVNLLASRGYISGYPCGGPGEPCGSANLPYFRTAANATRGQIAKIVSNTAGFGESPGDQLFQDVAPGSTFYDYVQRLASRTIMSGYPCGGAGESCVPPGNLPYFRPNRNATRGQVSKIVANTFFPGCQAP